MALYVLFGLFVFGDWPRRRHVSTRPTTASVWVLLLRLSLALLVAFGLGVAVAHLSPRNGAIAGRVAGTLYFLLWYRWLKAWRVEGPRDLRRLKGVRIGLVPRQVRFLRVNLGLLALLGLAIVGLQQGPEIALRLGVAACIYPIGLGISLAKPLAWPVFWLRRNAERMVVRIRARLAIGRAVKAHRLRNRALVGKPARHALCRTHLARFEPRRARFAYGRHLSFWSCRQCHSDAAAIPGAAIVRGVFDGELVDVDIAQQDKVLLVNLLKAGISLPLPLELAEVYVATVSDPHDIERFVVAYQNATFPVEAPGLHEIKLTIAPDADLDLNIQNLLRSRFRS